MQRNIPILFLAFAAASAARCLAFVSQATVLPVPLPDSRVDGFTFPESEASLTAQITAASGDPGSADTQAAFAQIHLHAWGLWTALTQETGQTYEGQRLRVFETWSTPQDLLSGRPPSRWRPGLAELQQSKMARFASSRARAVSGPGDLLIGFVKLDPVGAAHATSENIYRIATLQTLLSAGAQQVTVFPSASLVVKSIYKLIDPASAVGNRYYRLPAWSGPPAQPQPWGPDKWPGCVWVDLLGGGADSGAIDTVAASDGSSRTRDTTYPLSSFIHVLLSADDASALNSETPGAGAKAGDTALLVGMHVAGRETARWTWQTFWWAPSPIGPPAPSSATIASVRPPQLLGAPRHYAMALAYAMLSPDQPYVGGENAGRAIYAYNPWIEAAFGPSDLPDSIPGLDPNGQPAANNIGVQTNCMSCHARATFNPLNLATAPRFSGARYVDLVDPQFTGTLQTDFLWSVPRLSQ
jgi:hypothetical protein